LAVVLAFVAIGPLLFLSSALLSITADREAVRHTIAAPLGLVCTELTKRRSQHTWFPWYSDSQVKKMRPPKVTMLSSPYKINVFSSGSQLAGKAFQFETLRAKCKHGQQEYTVKGNIKFGRQPQHYGHQSMSQYRMVFELIAHEGHTEIVASMQDCRSLGSLLPNCSALPEYTQKLFVEAFTVGLPYLASRIEAKSTTTASCGLSGAKTHHPCKATAVSSATPVVKTTDYLAFLLTASVFGALLGFLYHFMRYFLARVPDQLFGDEAWDKMTDSSHGFEKDILGIQHDHLGFWDVLSPRNMAVCSTIGALAPVILGLALWEFNGSILGDACHKIGLFGIAPYFCS
jgi:hypothetical protein